MRCLVLERHFRAGGFTHAFERHGFSWDVGIHYIGGMTPDSDLYRILNYISDGSLRWHPMPDDFDVFEYPGLTFKVPNSEAEYKRRLTELFPAERAAIVRYFKDMKSTTRWMQFYAMARILPGPVAAIMRFLEKLSSKLALMTTGDYLKKNFKDERLRGLLVSHWGDYGLPPAQSAFFIHSLITLHYLEGAWYPVGGGGSLFDSILPVIEKAGGCVRVNHDVQKVLYDDAGRVRGVSARTGAGARAHDVEFYAPIVVSDAGALNTYTKLCDRPVPFLEELKAMAAGKSAVTLYVGLKEDPAALGFKGENHWISNTFDHDSIPTSTNELLNGKPRAAFLSFPSMKDPAAKKHTAEIISFAEYEPFQAFASLPWKKRGSEYEKVKERIAEGLLDIVEQRYPGFKALVEFKEVSTPVTVEHFTNFASGSIYGIPATPDR
ncbi:MAG: NAD(P)/FAD-dependent oxidoreductase, partial [Spirochaetia bacterium]|nr:NAD(P)/FAD-dependent oxidoreductase [Spirochaetia bacterium]